MIVPDAAPIGVLIADDDPLVRAGLVMMLGGAPDIRVLAQAGDGAEVLPLAGRHRPDVVLMDIRMPVMDGLAATEALRARDGAPEVIVLTTFDADEHVLRALRAGAAGFLLKDTPPPRKIEAVRAVAKGEPVLSPSVARQVIAAATGGPEPARPRARAELSRLTERELEVAVEVARGRSNAEIAECLYMSVATVKANITRIFAKLGTDNRVQVAMKVRDAGLL